MVEPSKGLFPLQPGDPRTIGDYTVLNRLGSGSQGNVFYAVTRAGTTLAIKYSEPDHASSGRFAREVETARNVRGLHVAEYVGHSLDARRPWLAMTHLAIPSVREYVKQRRLTSSAEITAFVLQTVEGLDEIHRAGVAHRDLSPANVLWDGTTLKIIDYGVAGLLTVEGPDLTRGRSVGTSSYMSPEQLRGERVTQASDLFALGCLIGYALTGRKVYPEEERDLAGTLTGANGALALESLSLRNPRVSARTIVGNVCGNPDLSEIPLPYIGIVAWLLARRPEDRARPSDIYAYFGAPAATLDSTQEVGIPIGVPGFTRTSSEPEAVDLPARIYTDTTANTSASTTLPPPKRTGRLGSARGQGANRLSLLERFEAFHGPFGVRKVVVTSRRPGNSELFVVLTDGRLVHRWTWPEGGWNDVSAKVRIRNVAAGSASNGHLELFAAAAGNYDLIHRWHLETSGWSEWTPMEIPEHIQSQAKIADVTVASRGNGNSELIVAFANGTIAHRWFWEHGPWQDWHVLSIGVHVRCVAMISMSLEHLEVFGVLGDGSALVHRWYWDGPGWSDWIAMDIPAHLRRESRIDNISAVSAGSGRCDIYATLGNGTVLERQYGPDGSWHDWTMFSASPPIRQTCASGEVFGTLNFDGSLVHRWTDDEGVWSDWHPIELPFQKGM